jgi:uncharacterized protein
MPTRETFEAQLRDAMRSQDDLKKRTYRMILSAIQLAEVEKRGPLEEPAVLALLQREAKMRQESIADAEKAGRPDLAEESRAELTLIQSILPKGLTATELETIVREAVQQASGTTPADMGKVMKLVTPQTQGRADNREVSQLVRKALGG